MAKEVSAGLLMFRFYNPELSKKHTEQDLFNDKKNENKTELQVFLVHPGGPFYAKKDDGWWSIPKGLIDEGEDLSDAAKREFKEETNVEPKECVIPLGTVKLKSGKIVHAWAFETDFMDRIDFKSNEFSIEWPPKSGKFQEFPEVDRGEFFDIETAKKKILPAQLPFIQRLEAHLAIHS